jgi:hypothetical protein
MSTAPFLVLVSEVLPVQRRDFYMNDATLLNPNNANPLIDGEWLQLGSTYKIDRGTGNQAKPAWQVFAERGRYDTQAIGKTTLLFAGAYEAETTVCDTTGLAVGDGLIVKDVTVGGLTKRGLAAVPVGVRDLDRRRIRGTEIAVRDVAESGIARGVVLCPRDQPL